MQINRELSGDIPGFARHSRCVECIDADDRAMHNTLRSRHAKKITSLSSLHQSLVRQFAVKKQTRQTIRRSPARRITTCRSMLLNLSPTREV